MYIKGTWDGYRAGYNVSEILIEVNKCANETSTSKNITCKSNEQIDSWLSDKTLTSWYINEMPNFGSFDPSKVTI